jgi:UDP-N-acetylmuramoyl-L-alanyl-D-glutamate--2,6-diaminopimelate ligase
VKLLRDLVRGLKIERVDGDLNVQIKSVCDDSRKAPKGCLFVAIKGLTFDSHSAIGEVIERGGRAVVYDGNLTGEQRKELSKRATLIRVDNSRKALATLAAKWFDNPANSMKFIGITGTNGKTTTSEFVYQFLKALGKKVGLISTISAKCDDKEIDTGYHVTSPEPLELHKYLRYMRDLGCEYVVLETTSHALDQYRCYGITFEVSGITNITPEHLDYHISFARYVEAKARIFSQSKKVLLNKYDPSLARLLKLAPKGTRVVDSAGINVPKEFTDKFPGEFNKQNLALAYELTRELVDQKLNEKMKDLASVIGRFEYALKGENGRSVVIDFAHTPDALEKIIKVTRPVTKNRLILVFGCAGLRDKSKRYQMGKIGQKMADLVVVTSEDPRTEDINDINRAIVSGIEDAGGKKGKSYFVIIDRQQAINFAIRNLAQKGDLVLITGKGHEKSMCIGKTEYPWSEHEAVKKALSRL